MSIVSEFRGKREKQLKYLINIGQIQFAQYVVLFFVLAIIILPYTYKIELFYIKQSAYDLQGHAKQNGTTI